ncbi:M14 family zinc carboxypeptidase [Pendulispora albinea]|uniref:Peptidase M14 domain-containing protein n=1 Tax=Pendulispora albinea TaxID=2741071 RepID=A0ABZ2LY61_9BACT
MKRRGLGAMAFSVIFGAAACSSAGSSGDETTAASSGPMFEYRVHDAVARADDLAGAGLDLLEKRSGNDLFVLGDANTANELRALGFEATIHQVLPIPSWDPPKPDLEHTSASISSSISSAAADPITETYYGGYHTIRAQYAHLDKVAADHPDLVRVITYGQSWRKQRGLGGYDLKAICITKRTDGDCALNPNSPKPRFFLYAQMHSRELTTGDVAWRWIDYLVENYPTDAAVKELLDGEEMWVVPLANPDGTEVVQSGGNNPLLQRKNLNTSNETRACTVPNHGIDMNRNFDSSWGGSSTSTNPCSQTYLGPSPDSELEVSATENLWRQLFADVRGPNRQDPSPVDAKGLIVSLHSDANTVMFPWYYSSSVHSANDATQRAIAKKLGTLTGYDAGQSGEVLYASGGNSGDWAYDKLGTSIFTIEVGDNAPNDGLSCGGFFPPYSCQAAFFWPKMKPAIVYAARKAVSPFRPE